MTEQNEVLGFIYKRIYKRYPFPYNSDIWNDYNTYYFAYVLKARFPQTIVYYDTIHNTFFAYIDGIAYNHRGIILNYDNEYVSKNCVTYDNINSTLKEKILQEHIL